MLLCHWESCSWDAYMLRLSLLQWNLWIKDMHIGASHFVLCRGSKCVLINNMGKWTFGTLKCVLWKEVINFYCVLSIHFWRIHFNTVRYSNLNSTVHIESWPHGSDKRVLHNYYNEHRILHQHILYVGCPVVLVKLLQFTSELYRYANY